MNEGSERDTVPVNRVAGSPVRTVMSEQRRIGWSAYTRAWWKFVAAGHVNRVRIKMLGIPLTLMSEATEWQPGERMSFRSIEPGRPAIGVATHRFDPCPEGTLYTWSMDFVPTGLGGRITAVVSAAMFERNAAAQQERVRRVLEAVEQSRSKLDLDHPGD